MKKVPLGDKRNIRVKVKRLDGSGAINLTSPERKILDANKTMIADWAAALWNSTSSVLYMLCDTTAAPFNAVGTYYVQLRGVIDTERYTATITVKVSS